MARLTRRLALVVALVAHGALAACNGAGDTPARRPSASRPADPAPSEEMGELPVPRTEVSGAAWRGALVVAGGLTPDGGASSLVHTYDAATGSWKTATRLPVALHHAGMAAAGDRLYVAGGYSNRPGQPWVPQAAVHSIGPGERVWRDERPMPAGPRGALGLAWAGGFLVAVGGESGGAPVATTEVFDVAAGAWRVGPDLPVPREHLAVAARDARVFAIAGRAAGKGNFTVVESFDPSTGGEWRVEPDLGEPRGGIGAASVDGRLCVAGGEEAAGTIASVECLDGDRWVRAAELARPRHGLAVIALDGRLHVVAGGEMPGLFVSGAHEALDL